MDSPKLTPKKGFTHDETKIIVKIVEGPAQKCSDSRSICSSPECCSLRICKISPHQISEGTLSLLSSRCNFP